MTTPSGGARDGVPATTHHVRRDDAGGVLGLVRIRRAVGEVHGEVYEPGAGWTTDPSAFDVAVNGQDYDLLDADDADRLAEEMEAGRA